MAYIERETALKIIDNYANTVTEDGKVIVDAIRDIVAVITPTADIVEVKYGQWIQDQYINQECSSCGFELSDDASYEMYYDCYRKPKYCPECGAKIDITPPKVE